MCKLLICSLRIEYRGRLVNANWRSSLIPGCNTLKGCVFRTVLGYSEFVCMSAIWQTIWDTAVGALSDKDFTCYSLSDHAPFGQGQILCQWTSCQLCHIIQSDMLNVYDSPTHFILFTFLSQWSVNFRDCLICNRVSFLVISSSWCGYHFECYTKLLSLLLSGFWVTFILYWSLVRFYA